MPAPTVLRQSAYGMCGKHAKLTQDPRGRCRKRRVSASVASGVSKSSQESVGFFVRIPDLGKPTGINGSDKMITMKYQRMRTEQVSYGRERTVRGDVGPGLSKAHLDSIDAVQRICTNEVPIHGDWNALEQIREEEANCPYKIDSNHDPHCQLKPTILKDSTPILVFDHHGECGSQYRR